MSLVTSGNIMRIHLTWKWFIIEKPQFKMLEITFIKRVNLTLLLAETLREHSKKEILVFSPTLNISSKKRKSRSKCF